MEHLQSIPSSEQLVIVATGKYVGEGFDYARLDMLFLVSPVAWKGIVAQYAGRLHREYEGKQDVQIYDYIDIRVPVCESMYRKRLKGYASIGYRIRNNEVADLMANGIEIVLYTKEENEDTISLQHQGISVIYKGHLSLHTAIIDKSTIWYGSANILGYRSPEDNLIRFRNSEIASNLLDSLQK